MSASEIRFQIQVARYLLRMAMRRNDTKAAAAHRTRIQQLGGEIRWWEMPSR